MTGKVDGGRRFTAAQLLDDASPGRLKKAVGLHVSTGDATTKSEDSPGFP
jgi:hypothetical protein